MVVRVPAISSGRDGRPRRAGRIRTDRFASSDDNTSMRTIWNRIHRLEAARGHADVQEDQYRALAEAIKARQRELYGPDYKDPYADLPPLSPPPRDLADAINRRRLQIMEYERADELKAQQSQGAAD